MYGNIHSNEAELLFAPYPVLKRCLQWLRELPVDAEEGTVELEGPDCYAMIQDYDTLPENQCRWESHREMIDIQVCLSGSECIDCLPATPLEPDGEFSAERDVQFWQAGEGGALRLNLQPGTFALFLPGTEHRPKVASPADKHVHKVVIKIAASLL